jgi:hypothetical protein
MDQCHFTNLVVIIFDKTGTDHRVPEAVTVGRSEIIPNLPPDVTAGKVPATSPVSLPVRKFSREYS